MEINFDIAFHCSSNSSNKKFDIPKFVNKCNGIIIRDTFEYNNTCNTNIFKVYTVMFLNKEGSIKFLKTIRLVKDIKIEAVYNEEELIYGTGNYRKDAINATNKVSNTSMIEKYLIDL